MVYDHCCILKSCALSTRLQVSFRRTAIHIRLPQATTFGILDYEETGWYLPQSLKLKGKKAFIKALIASKG